MKPTEGKTRRGGTKPETNTPRPATTPKAHPAMPEHFDGGMKHFAWSWAMKNFCEYQAEEIKRLKAVARRMAISWAQAWDQTSSDDMAWKDEYDQALRDRHEILLGESHEI